MRGCKSGVAADDRSSNEAADSSQISPEHDSVVGILEVSESDFASIEAETKPDGAISPENGSVVSMPERG